MMPGRVMEAVFFALMFGCALRGIIGGSDSPPSKAKTLVYYIHESLAGSNTSVVTIGGQDNNLTFLQLGLTVAFDSIITLTDNSRDAVVGMAIGLGTTSKDTYVSHISSTHSLNSTKLGVGSLELAGIFDASYPYKASEWVVSGGTGDFRFLAGVASILPVYFVSPYHSYQVTVSLM